MRSIGRKRQEKLNKAISALVDARLKGFEAIFYSRNDYTAQIIAYKFANRHWDEEGMNIAQWRCSRYIEPRRITFEEADRLIRKHIGFGS